MTRPPIVRNPTALRRTRNLAWVLCLALPYGLAGCGASGDGEASETYTLPDTGESVDLTPGFTPEDSSGRKADSGAIPEVIVYDAGQGDSADEVTDATTGDDGSVDSVSQADVGPETVAPITSCASHCGVYLENNDCHCHESCLGDGSCCADFSAVCGCKKDADCDDANDCTADTCKVSGYCFQQPMKSCCLSDSECSGGDACHTAKCLSGTCTLQPMDCNDGIDCTQDFCDKGDCQHKTAPTQCLIDGACHKTGDQDPESGGCATCDPLKSQTAWSLKVGMCSIGGECIKSGAFKSPTETCAVCDPTKSTTSWSAKTGTCQIDGACYKAGELNPNSTCQLCDPAASGTGWSGKSGSCSIDNLCWKAGDVDPANPCRSCDPLKNKNDWTVKTGSCFIGGACVASGASATGSGGCQVCDTKTPTAWTIKAGIACNAGSSCITAAKCDAAGACTGTKTAGCCVNDDDCAADPKLSPGPCEIKGCDTSKGLCVLKPKVGCCTQGVCCDVASMTMKPVNSVCGTFAKDYEYKCDGDAGYKRPIYDGCTGTEASKCSSSTPGYGDWVVSLKCSTGSVCMVDPSTGFPKCKAL